MNQRVKVRPAALLGPICAGGLAIACLLSASGANAACEDLAKFPLKDGKIISAVPFAANAPIELSVIHIKLPAPIAFCRVAATLTPTPDSAIMAEVWLPDPAQWNGKFFGIGNGGFGGTVAAPALDMRTTLARGYAAAGNDLGHETPTFTIDASWAIGHPEKVKDFAFRADHVTAEFAKTVIRAYYGRAPELSYFRGCSNGGHEALMEAQKFPGDYDGIIAGAPANSWTHLMTGFLWNENALFAKPDSKIPDSKLAIIQQAALADCDALDGAKDGIINDPSVCHFDPRRLLCKGADAPECLTQPQLDALRKIYGGPVNPRTGKSIYPGYPPGSEALPQNWSAWITSASSNQRQFANQFYGTVVLEKPGWDFRNFDFDKDVSRTDATIGPTINSNDPDLSAFAARGGKLIVFQGWSDAAVTPWGTIDYYRSLQKKMGAANARRFVRLFMAPGMMHCGGGPGPNSFDTASAIEQWREKNTAPEQLVASRYANSIAALMGSPGKALATRPVCAYPAVPHWTGKGSFDEAQNYVCRVSPSSNPRVAAR